MSQCSNCYNGCSEITSDKCIKYTGVNIPALDIKTGDSLSWVEQALISFLTATIDGSGIEITLEESDYCALVSGYLQECSTVTALDLFRALVKAACDLQTQIDAEKARIDAIEADYTVDCLEGVVSTDGTHSILQAVIDKLCALEGTVTALATDLETNYVKLSDLNSLIAAYLEDTAPTTRYSSKMIPYVAVEYYGSITGFDSTGAGIIGTEWEDIYLCNGDNGTPDHRGRVGVGATSTPGVIAMDSAVDPVVPGNPAYTLSDTAHGANTITLDVTQIPSHNHVLTQNPHTHDILVDSSGTDLPNGSPVYPVMNSSNGDGGSATTNPIGLTSSAEDADISLASTGGGLSHNNYQPGIGCYYIMYIP